MYKIYERRWTFSYLCAKNNTGNDNERLHRECTNTKLPNNLSLASDFTSIYTAYRFCMVWWKQMIADFLTFRIFVEASFMKVVLFYRLTSVLYCRKTRNDNQWNRAAKRLLSTFYLKIEYSELEKKKNMYVELLNLTLPLNRYWIFTHIFDLAEFFDRIIFPSKYKKWMGLTLYFSFHNLLILKIPIWQFMYFFSYTSSMCVFVKKGDFPWELKLRTAQKFGQKSNLSCL